MKNAKKLILFIITVTLMNVVVIKETSVTENIGEGTEFSTEKNAEENIEENEIEKLEFVDTEEIISNEKKEIAEDSQTAENKEIILSEDKKTETTIENTEISIGQNVEENEIIAIQIQTEKITSTFDENAFNSWHLKTYPKFAEQYATLIINKIGVNAPIYFGDTAEIILKGVGHDMGSYFSGEGGSIVLCEHNYMNNFRRLRRIKKGRYYRNKNRLRTFLLRII